MPYQPPGVTLTEVPTPASVSLSETQRYPIYIGKGSIYKKVTNESVVRTSSGYADSLAYTSEGIYEIISVGSQQNLDDYVVSTDYNLTSDQVVWTSTGSIPVAGATYYVTYRYNRPSSDYDVLKWFSSIEDVINDIGDLTSTNDISRIAYIGLKILGLPLIGVIQTASPYSTVDFQDSIDVAKEVNYLLSLCVLSTAYAVQTYLKAHVKERSLPQNKRERMTYMGAAVGTLPGNTATASTIAGNAYALRTEEVVYLSPARVKYTYRNTSTNLIETKTEDGAFLAAAVASYKDSIPDPSAPVTRHDLAFMNLELYDADRDTYFGETVMNTMGGAGVFVLHPVGARLLIRDDITTDTTDVRRNELNVVVAKHYITRFIREDLDDTFVGNKIINRAQYALAVKNRLIRIFSTLRGKTYIENFDAGDMFAQVVSTNPRVVLIRYAYIAAYTNKRIEGEYFLKLA